MHSEKVIYEGKGRACDNCGHEKRHHIGNAKVCPSDAEVALQTTRQSGYRICQNCRSSYTPKVRCQCGQHPEPQMPEKPEAEVDGDPLFGEIRSLIMEMIEDEVRRVVADEVRKVIGQCIRNARSKLPKV